MDCWHFQRRDLGRLGRLVFYDQRSHGASGRSPREHSTIDQLGADLFAVLRTVAPDGPIVLVGHWGELLWLVAPPSRAQGPALRWTDLAATLAIGGFWLARLLSRLADPRFARPPDAAIARHG